MKNTLFALILGFISLTASQAFASGYCIAKSGVADPAFGSSWEYEAFCSWTDKSVRKASLAFFGHLSAAKKEKLKTEVAGKLAQVGVTQITSVGRLDIYSNTPLAPEANVCVISVLENNASEIKGCTPNTKLIGDILENTDSRELVLANGFKKVSSIHNAFYNKAMTEIYIK